MDGHTPAPVLPMRETVCNGVDLIVGDVLASLPLIASGSVQCIVTSPPYWGLRDYSIAPTDWPAVKYFPMAGLPPVVIPAERCALGLETSPLAFIGHLIHVFRSLRRVLRADGTVWVNLGASYASGGKGGGGSYLAERRAWAERSCQRGWRGPPTGLKEKDLVGIPWMFALAMQADGWWLRSEVIWRKPNPMPEATRDRPTVAHEQVFLFARSKKYFYDATAIAEPLEHPEASTPDDMARAMTRRRATTVDPHQEPLDARRYRSGNRVAKTGNDRGRPGDHRKASIPWEDTTGKRNARSVWTIATQPFKGAHFATFPEEMARRCILAGTSAYGCCSACGTPRRRVAEREFAAQADVSPERAVRGAGKQKPLDALNRRQGYPRGTTAVRTLGWGPACDCGAATVPCVVLDPFAGSGTVGAVTKTAGRSAVLIEASERYAADCLRPRVIAAPGYQPTLGGLS